MGQPKLDLDFYAEQGVLAGILVDPTIFDSVANIVDGECFKEPRHELIFGAIKHLHSRQETVNIIAVAEHLKQNNELQAVGGVPYLTELTSPEGTYSLNSDPESYARLVFESFQRRQVGDTLTQVLRQVNAGQVTSDNAIGVLQNSLRQIGERSRAGQQTVKLSDDIGSAFERLREKSLNPTPIQGIPTGLTDLDRLTTGFLPGQFIILAARPAIGKSTLALDFARAASIKSTYTTLFFSLEMSREEIVDKILSAESNVEHDRIRKGMLGQDEWGSLDLARQKIVESKLYIDDSPKINIEYMRLVCQQQAQKPEGIDLIVVDYLQLMSSGRRIESRQQEVSDFSRNLKLLAKELGVPVVALSQLNRGVENRQDKMPSMSDLRESGSLEQDADIILLLHRPDASGDQTLENPLLIVAKNRGGETGRIQIVSMLEYSKFGNGAGMFAGVEPLPADFEPPIVQEDDYFVDEDGQRISTRTGAVLGEGIDPDDEMNVPLTKVAVPAVQVPDAEGNFEGSAW